MSNQVDEPRKVRARLSANACYYTGVPSDKLGTHVFEDTIKPKAGKMWFCLIKHTRNLSMLFTKCRSKIWLLLYCLIVDRELLLHVVPEDYMHLIKPESMVKVYLKGTVLDNNRSYARQDTFTFTKPTLEIQVNLIYSTITVTIIMSVCPSVCQLLLFFRNALFSC